MFVTANSKSLIMRLKFKWILTLLTVLSIQFSFAQEKTISGIVTDNSGPLPGVNVVIKGTTRGVQTDFDGKYSIKANTGDVLLFSFIGTQDKSATVGASNKINVSLESSAKSLDEVVVVAYGKQTAKSIVGSVATIDSSVLLKQQATNVMTALQGSVSGVNIIAAGGMPGESPTIRIRGTGSINASSDPLIILDGAPFNGNLNAISSDQIESMSVLKDASSTALYGSRGANGVILITTKRGNFNSAPKIAITSTTGFANNAVPLHKMVGSDRYMQLNWEAMRNTNQYINGQAPALAGTNASNALVTRLGYNPYTAATPVDANGNLVTTEKKWDTNWANLILDNSAVRTEHTLALSAGSENTKYYFTTNYLSQEGNVTTSKFDRLNTRLSIDTKVNEWLKSGVTMFYSTSDQNFPSQSGTSYQSAVQFIYNVPSIYPVYRRDGNGDLLLNGKGEKQFDYGANTGQLVNASRPVFENENAFGSLYKYDLGCS